MYISPALVGVLKIKSTKSSEGNEIYVSVNLHGVRADRSSPKEEAQSKPTSCLAEGKG